MPVAWKYKSMIPPRDRQNPGSNFHGQPFLRRVKQGWARKNDTCSATIWKIVLSRHAVNLKILFCPGSVFHGNSEIFFRPVPVSRNNYAVPSRFHETIMPILDSLILDCKWVIGEKMYPIGPNRRRSFNVTLTYAWVLSGSFSLQWDKEWYNVLPILFWFGIFMVENHFVQIFSVFGPLLLLNRTLTFKPYPQFADLQTFPLGVKIDRHWNKKIRKIRFNQKFCILMKND